MPCQWHCDQCDAFTNNTRPLRAACQPPRVYIVDRVGVATVVSAAFRL
jgi:hypothetical protein